MNERMAFCPQCKNDVAFVTVGNSRTCPVCGFQFKLTDPPPIISPSAGSQVMSVFRVLLIVFAIMVGIAVVGVGVLFAGCALMLGH
ncbi:MAG TPA: hypothetical protein VN578_23280 [Candidatus Binatia bacterium]|nr:hypothetical protein [Candidatus Binatia bacterium]